MYRSTLVLILAAVAGCAGFTSEYQDRLRRSTYDPRGVEILSSKQYPGRILCGEYVSVESNGMVRRTRPYVIGEDFVLPVPSREEVSVYCNRDPQGALFQQMGIGGPEAQWSQLRKVGDDMAALYAGINSYYDSRNTLPVALSDLTETVSGITEENLVDPWGSPYIYEGGLAGRSKPNPKLSTYGADGRAGGRGADADVSLAELPALQHVLRLRSD